MDADGAVMHKLTQMVACKAICPCPADFGPAAFKHRIDSKPSLVPVIMQAFIIDRIEQMPAQRTSSNMIARATLAVSALVCILDYASLGDPPSTITSTRFTHINQTCAPTWGSPSSE